MYYLGTLYVVYGFHNYPTVSQPDLAEHRTSLMLPSEAGAQEQGSEFHEFPDSKESTYLIFSTAQCRAVGRGRWELSGDPPLGSHFFTPLSVSDINLIKCRPYLVSPPERQTSEHLLCSLSPESQCSCPSEVKGVFSCEFCTLK